MPEVHSSADSPSVDPEPSGVRLSDPDVPDDALLPGEREEIDADGCDADEPSEEPEGSFLDAFLGDDDEVATDRVWRMFARSSINNGFGDDLTEKHAKRFPPKERSGAPKKVA